MSIEKLLDIDSDFARLSVVRPKNGCHIFLRNAMRIYRILNQASLRDKILHHIDSGVAYAYAGQAHAQGIPKVTHRVWLTSPMEPQMPAESFLNKYIESLETFPSDWRHIFWTNSLEVRRKVSKILSKYCVEVNIIGSLAEGGYELPLQDGIDRLILQKKYAFACDQVRLCIVYAFGGIYCDMGIKFRADIGSLAQNFPYVFMIGDGLFFQNALFATRAGDPIIRNMIEILLNPAGVPRELIGDLTPLSEGWLAAGPMMTLLFFLTVPDTAPVLILKGNENLIKWAAQKSWYKPDDKGEGVNRSAIVEHTALSIIDPASWEKNSSINLLPENSF